MSVFPFSVLHHSQFFFANHFYHCHYSFIYSQIIKIKIKVYNNMQLKYIKQIKPHNKSKNVTQLNV